LYKVEQSERFNWKPSGLYCAPNTEWEEWCEDNGFATSTNEFKYELVGDLSNLLIVDLSNVIEFENNYADFEPTDLVENKYDDPFIEFMNEQKRHFKGFRWREVARDYPGVWIKYHELRGLLPWRSWVSALDVETVVIWNPRDFFLKKIEKIIYTQIIYKYVTNYYQRNYRSAYRSRMAY